VQVVPLRLDDKARQLYHVIHAVDSVDVFVLDTRNGYLGKQQTEWLSESIFTSVAKFKVILYGAASHRFA
jgi:phosphodiesterase/alkaline phosphatase D-like protein